MSTPTPRVIATVQADPAVIGGVYAHMLNIWHSPHEFTLDFLVTAQPPQPGEGPDGGPAIQVQNKLVARVRMPPGVIFDVIRALNENMTNYEQAFGEVKRPGQDAPLYPPEEPGDTGGQPPR